MYTFLLHPPTAVPQKLDKAVDLNFEGRCAEQVYFCLTFAHGIIDAIMVSHRGTGTTKRNATRDEIKKRMQHDSYADFYFEAALDCAIILLPHADLTYSLATILAKFADAGSWKEDYILRRFDSKYQQLESEIHYYCRVSFSVSSPLHLLISDKISACAKQS